MSVEAKYEVIMVIIQFVCCCSFLFLLSAFFSFSPTTVLAVFAGFLLLVWRLFTPQLIQLFRVRSVAKNEFTSSTSTTSSRAITPTTRDDEEDVELWWEGRLFFVVALSHEQTVVLGVLGGGGFSIDYIYVYMLFMASKRTGLHSFTVIMLTLHNVFCL